MGRIELLTREDYKASRGWLETSFFIESEVTLSRKRVPNCALDNADIVREAILRKLQRSQQPGG